MHTGQPLRMQMTLWFLVMIGFVWLGGTESVYAIDVNITLEEAQKTMASGRESMEKAQNVNDVATIMKAAEQTIRVGADPEKDPCGAHAILRTRRYWLGYFGRREAAESKRQNKPVRMPETKVQEILNMPYLEVEIRLCGDEEFFAEGVDVALQQGTSMARPVDVGPAERGRKNSGPGPAYRSRFTARFAYADFDPTESAVLAVFFPDGKLINIPANLSQIR